MKNFKVYLEEATFDKEKVKRSMVAYINDNITAAGGNPISIQIGRNLLSNIVAAKPYNKSSKAGIAPYADIELIQSGGRSIRIGLRTLTGKKFDSRTIPALEKGMTSLEKMFPNIRRDYLASLLDHLTQDKSLNHAQPLKTTVYGRLSDEMLRTALFGSLEFGGECDYIFAIQRMSFRYKAIRIPEMKPVASTGGLVLKVKDGKLFDQTTALKNNDIHLFVNGMKNRTLNLSNDMVDEFNNPIVVGPKFGSNKVSGKLKQEVVAKPNYTRKKSETILIKSGLDRVFDIEMKSPAELVGSELSRLSGGSNVYDRAKENAEDDDMMPSSRSSRGSSRFDRDDDETNPYADIEDRDELIDQVFDNMKRAAKLHKMNIDMDDDDVEETIKANLDTEDTSELRRMSLMPVHRLRNELVSYMD